MGIVIKVVVGLLLFAGSLVGGLAATGRLNHDGVANIPGLNLVFPAPPEAPTGDAKDGDAGKPGEAGKAGAAAEGADHGSKPGEADPESANAAETDAATKPRRKKIGRSLNEPEPAKDAHGGHGGGHGEADAHGGDAAGHGADAHAAGDDHAKAGDGHAKAAAGGAAKAGDAHGKAAPVADARASAAATHAAQRDLQRFGDALAAARAPYEPGNLYRFDGLPAGVSADQINEAWQRVQAQIAELDRRKAVLDQQEQQMREIGEDVSRRQAALGKERVEVEQMQRQLDARIQKFQQTVTLVRADEAAALKRNAQTLTSFEAAKAAELLEAQWKTERGQEEALKLMEFMDKDALNEILAAMPAATTADVLKKRLRVTKEAAAPAK